MCGIAGFVRSATSAPLAVDLDRMQKAVAHRGPDDAGAWRAQGDVAGFAHTRLAIIDVSAAGHQPMSVDGGRLTISYNGEIYNYADLRRALVDEGVEFRSHSDTEVILRLYQKFGAACVERLRGMFAFAIWDAHERTCFLARDPFGIKPLYFATTGAGLVFASEVRSLLASGIVSPRLDAQAVYEYFRTGSVPEPQTLVAGVHALPAGHHMTWNDGRITTTAYWRIEFPEPVATPDAAERTRAALTDSIRHHFVSDVPVGVFLSGGLDSTALVALGRAAMGERLQTFSLTVPGSSLDEGPLARRTAEHFGTDHHEWALTGEFARAAFDAFLRAADQPSIDGFNTFLVCRLAAQYHTKVVLSGLGGDELFGGYPSFRDVPRLERIGRVLRATRPLSRMAIAGAAQVGGSRIDRLRDLTARPATTDTAYRVYRGIFSQDESHALALHFVPGADVEERGAEPASDPSAADAVSRLELTRYLRNQLLRDSDVMSMASGIELRVPMLDAQLFAAIRQIPASERLAPGKALLRRAVPEIPSWVLMQPKRGFMFPYEQWISTSLSDAFGRLEPIAGVRMDTWYRKWCVVAFERWVRHTLEGNWPRTN